MEQPQTPRPPTNPAAYMAVAKAVQGCIFCGGSRLAATRLWPHWLDRKCPDPSGQQGDSTSPPVTPLLVCTQCSEGWITDLDRQAEQLLGPVLEGAHAMVSSTQLRVLSGWLCLQAVKLADGSGIPLPDRVHLRHTGQPPQNWSIFVAGLHKAAGIRFCRHHPCRIEFSGNPIAGHSRGRPVSVSNSLLLSLGLGPLFFHLFSSPSLINLHDFAAASRHEGLSQIWPPARRFGILTGRHLSLPPDRTLTDEEARRLTEASRARLRPRVGAAAGD